jgi:hypothetical protein
MMSLLITSKQELCELWMNIAYDIIYLDVYMYVHLDFLLPIYNYYSVYRIMKERKTERIYMYTNEPRTKFLRSVQ